MRMFGHLGPRAPHAPTPAESIEAIPADRITDVERQTLLARIARGDEVYAYTSGGRWLLWDTETRINLVLLAERWEIRSMLCTDATTHVWEVVLRAPGSVEDVTVQCFVNPSAHYDRTLADYVARAQRRITDAVMHCLTFQLSPTEMDGKTI